MKLKLWTLSVALTLLTVGTAFAQPTPPPPPPPAGPPPPLPPGEAFGESRELLEQVMMTRLSRQLGLSDEQSLLLMRRFSELREQQQELRRERAEVMRELRGVVKKEQDEAALKQLMERLDGLNKKLAASNQDIRGAAKDMNLTVWQQAKLEIFLGEFEGEMRRIVQQARGGKSAADGLGPDRPRPFRGPDGALEGPGARLRDRDGDPRRPRQGKAGELPGPRPPRAPETPVPPTAPVE